ncbi:hypothetical protein Glove_248g48 [Diversispora epigaea]|uniref:Uncharacterized protein n=1 Tax=Diversispora epigaea TaxID=1348612 RepID=A0A397IF29_9GLOM|nr:hypothetical protein Glove_248g48 [Diversispora epigaea]
MSYSRVRGKFSEYGENYIVNIIKTPEAWLRFAKYYPPKYIRKRLLKLGYEINSRDYWENFVFRVENNLTSHKQIGNDPKYRDFKVQLALYKKNRSALIIQRAFHLWKKRINSAKIIQHATIQWIYRPGGAIMKQAKDRYYKNAGKRVDLPTCHIYIFDPYSYANSIGEPNLPEWYTTNTKIEKAESAPEPVSQEIDIPEEPKPDPIEVKRKRKTAEIENIARRVMRSELSKLVIEE